MKWISVKDDSPKNHAKVLFLLKEDFGDHNIRCLSGVVKKYRGDFWFYDHVDFIWHKEDVTHWRVIPEPPEE